MNWTAESLALLNDSARQRILDSLTEQEKLRLLFLWEFWRRTDQTPPANPDWLIWAIQAGRGFGKTRIGSEGVRAWAENFPGCRIALVGRTAADARDVMVEGESGIMGCCPPWKMPDYQPSKRRIVWPNGSLATTYSADQPDLLRGPQHHFAWGDEVAAWRYEEAWDNLLLGLRLGDLPRCLVTTTPKPTKTYRAVLKSEGVVVTRGSTYDNRGNLAPSFFRQVIKKYEGTRLGRQELLGDLLDDNPNALFRRSQIDADRMGTDKDGVPILPELRRIVVAIDPNASDDEDADEIGIIVAGEGTDGHGYVLEDLTLKGSPDEWANVAVGAYRRWRANCIVAERNNGGNMIEAVIRQVDKRVTYKSVWASHGKVRRAEPISTMYEQHRVHHVGTFAELEDQMCDYEPGLENQASPDRMDALVWALTYLFVGSDNTVHGFD